MFKLFGRTPNHQYPLMRQPDRLPRCYDMTEQERLAKVREWNNRNVWNDPAMAKQDQDTYYGA